MNVIATKQILNIPWIGNGAYEPANMAHRQRMHLHKTIAWWIVDHNDLLGLELSDEFLSETNNKPVLLPVLTLDYL